jgi:beta-lactamase regulating signal transducer with metallopeptidase domain
MPSGGTLTLIGTAAAHALWIGALVAAWAAVSCRLLHRAAPSVRYGMARAALVAAAAAPILVMAAAPVAAAPWQPWVGLAWLAGTGVLAIRLANSFRLVRRLVRTSSPAPAPWQSALAATATTLGIRRAVTLRVSTRLDQPCSVGVWRPLVLIPADLLANVTPAAFHAIAAHELAHVARRDYLWNLLLVGCETALFFHPAVAWLSRTAQRERELACDAAAGAVCDPVALAEALAAIEHRRVAPAAPVDAATEQPLLDRVRQLIAPGQHSPAAAPVALALSVAFGGGVLLPILWAAGLGGAPSPSHWMPLMTAAGLGLLVGLRHAFEPDHVVAVATMVARERNARSAARLGGAWGAGHTATLLAVGTLLIAARQTVPSSLVALFEAAVAVMIVGMGVRAIRDGVRLGSQGPVEWHDHGDRAHAHPMSADHVHVGSVAIARRPMLVGVVHGLAGSGALTALALASLPTWPAQVGFMLVFGLGSTAGMALVAGVAGWQLARVIRTPLAMATLSVTTGLAAVAFGLAWAYPLLAR